MTAPVLHSQLFRPLDARGYEQLFASNGWTNSWRDGVYDYHHYHANTHEVLGCYSGEALIRFGGQQGQDVTLRSGDVVVIPAGLAHCCIRASDDFAVVGAYPDGARPDLRRGEGEAIDLPRPGADPALGEGRGFAAPQTA